MMRQFWLVFTLFFTSLQYSQIPDAPERKRGEGPFNKLILRGGIVVNGTGAPPLGPVDIVIENNLITKVVTVGNPGVPINEKRRPKTDKNTKVIDIANHYILPGFFDMHGHLGGSSQGTPAEYVLKLWLAHGITSVREPGSFNGLDWTIKHQKKSQNNTIASPRIFPYVGFGMGSKTPLDSEKKVKRWVNKIAKDGAVGIKFFGAKPEIMSSAITEAKKLGLGTTMHHAQLNVAHMNVMDSSKLGLTSMEHWYGLPEALFTNQTIQNYPVDYNYQDEQHRFSEAGKLWAQAADIHSEKWNYVRDTLIERNLTLDPTFTIYEASRDLMKEQQAVWHKEFTLPSLWQFFQPNRNAHGSYWFDWTTAEEIQWKKNYQKWMSFVNDFKNHGGRVTTGSDAGYIYKLYGFGFIRELELLQEAGFHPLEVIQSATINGAEVLNVDDKLGSVDVGKFADLVIIKENPLQNFKVLYGTGHQKLNDHNQITTVGGVKYTIKDGIVYDAKQLLDDVKEIVIRAKHKPKSQVH